jgi:hypothetical protein
MSQHHLTIHLCLLPHPIQQEEEDKEEEKPKYVGAYSVLI